MLGLTDITAEVNSVEENLDCYFSSELAPNIPDNHGGSTAALLDFHGCHSGWVCQEHYQWWLLNGWPQIKAVFAVCGVAACTDCKKLCRCVDEFVRVYPL
jgi:hypothetical protein